jgi:predicted nucleic acid-binding protein
VIVVDTTVLVYAVGSEHPLRRPSRRIVRAVEQGRVAATTTVEVVQEFVHVRSRRSERADAAALGRTWASLFSPLLDTNEDDLALALDMYPRHPRLGGFDCLLAAAAMRRGVEVLVSADSAFAAVTGLRHVDPATAELDEVLSP